ncbi:MAG: 5-formyltetrahydrofolate cyclo-ligase [Helicobacter sp.]|nr:5-formyltetrahydrofolate cyclo-ligase [Helicobacteraceae bacterium]MDY3113840.1 5-formyltetrahydrofolate cyclo-ligase [Helicobacter sp.]
MDLKTQYRKNFKANLEKIKAKKNLYALDSKLTKLLKAEIDSTLESFKTQKRKNINILFYYPLPIEFNCKKLLNHYKKQKNLTILLPFMQFISFKLVKYRLPMQKRAFGVYEPSNSFFTTKKLDLAIIPTIGSDITLRRIGFGKGMYDRFFSAISKKPKIIFISRALNLSQEIITQSYDLQANLYLTPFCCLKFKDKLYDNLAYYKLRYIGTSCRRWELSNRKKNCKSK